MDYTHRRQLVSWLHHNRAVKIGNALEHHLAEYPPFESYQEFTRWARTLLGVGDQVVQYSLRKVGLWHVGIQGHAGGPQLEAMLHDIIAYAKAQGWSDEY